MKDSKLKSEDLIKIRQGLGGGSKATTQTARIARKLAEKTAKRNRISLEIDHDVWDERLEVDPHQYPVRNLYADGEQGRRAFIKKGGKRIAEADLAYNKGGKHISVDMIGPAGSKIKGHVANTIEEHDKYSRKVLSTRDVRNSMIELKKKFPNAETVGGWRGSGMRSKVQELMESRYTPEELETRIILGDDIDGVPDSDDIGRQKMKLPKLAEPEGRFARAVRSNSSRLRGAMKGVDMLSPKLGKALARGPAGLLTAPLEAGLTTYAKGGGVPLSVAAAATTGGFGAGITAALKKAGTVAAKHAPVLARVAGKAAVPLAVASAGYDLYRTVNEGYKAHKAATDARQNEAYMSENYGSIDAATATRRRRTGGR